MTLDYLTYLALTLLPPIGVLGVAARRRAADPGRVLLGTAAVALIAVVYTVPWDGALIRRHARALAAAVAVPTLYFWVVDRIALGLWSISPRYTTGIEPFELPIEEATFFLVTNLLVVTGVFLFRWVLVSNDADGPVCALAGLVPQAARLRAGAGVTRVLPWQ